MNGSQPAKRTEAATFRTNLLVAMMLIVSGITGLGLYLVDRNAVETVQGELRREFHAQVQALDHLQQIRRAALIERGRALVRRPRIHAALEDGALDLLYLSAKDELRDLMEPAPQQVEPSEFILRARFYRFLDQQGHVIVPPNRAEVGALTPAEESQLTIKGVPDRLLIGYAPTKGAVGEEELSEVIAMPITSTETGEAISSIVLGFKPFRVAGERLGAPIQGGIWFGNRLFMVALSEPARVQLQHELARVITGPNTEENNFGIQINDTRYLVFYKLLNPGSQYPPAYEICVFPLTELEVRQQRLRWQVVGAGALLLLSGLVVSHFVSARLSVPVEKLAIDSAENRVQRQKAEAALEMTSAELQRAARFSADASHQLKTPVTVLRAGLEELLARPNLTPEECFEISALVHQTYRLASVIEDLLLLSRMDAGRLKLDFSPVNLSQLIEGWLDDLAALPDTLELSVETNFPSELYIAGEKRYTTLIVQNLLENARKYNRRGGRIRITAWPDREQVFLTISNTADPIPPEVQEHIFERFHRGKQGENVSGNGLGLNLARELARIHKGELRLVRSDVEWTEFEVVFQRAEPAIKPAPADAK